MSAAESTAAVLEGSAETAVVVSAVEKLTAKGPRHVELTDVPVRCAACGCEHGSYVVERECLESAIAGLRAKVEAMGIALETARMRSANLERIASHDGAPPGLLPASLGQGSIEPEPAIEVAGVVEVEASVVSVDRVSAYPAIVGDVGDAG